MTLAVGDRLVLHATVAAVNAGLAEVELEAGGARAAIVINALAQPICSDCGEKVTADQMHFHHDTAGVWPLTGVAYHPGTPLHMAHVKTPEQLAASVQQIYPGCPVCRTNTAATLREGGS